MKKMKKFLATLMALVMCLSFNATVFADDLIYTEDDIHTVVFEVPAQNDNEAGIDPQMWGHQDPEAPDAEPVRSAPFIITDRYFAYEMTATDMNGNVVDGTYSVTLYIFLGNFEDKCGFIASMGNDINGITYKNDWITVESGKPHFFRIRNYSNTPIKVTLTYYSWA